MGNINLKRLVDIDIKSNVVRQIAGTRDTVVLYTAAGTEGTTHTFASYQEAATALTGTAFADTLSYLQVYYDNGGIKCHVIEGIDYTDLSTDTISALSNDYIIVACVIPEESREAGYNAIKTLAISRAADPTIYGINEKLLIGRTTSSEDESSVKLFAAKYSHQLGAEMTIAAYLCQINVYRQNVVHDYAFTLEALEAEDITDTVYGDLMLHNTNVDIVLAGDSRNMGGNCKNGADLTNTYVKIMVHQTLTNRLINLLVQKLKDAKGISQIYSAIAQELEQYRMAGYLSTDKIWTDEDLTIVYNDAEYTIINKGTALVSGYAIKILPLSSLTDADRAARKAPPIYVILAEQYGIRLITINGEVI